jgi:hypothetical protein
MPDQNCLLYHFSLSHAMMKFKDIDKKVAISETLK